MPSHEQNLELFQLLETAQGSISELMENPVAHPGELIQWEKTEEKVKEQLLLANQGLVASIAKKYEHFGVDAEDLMSVGCMGLAKAISKFDYRLGNQLSTYATWWIRQAISRSPSMQSPIRIPEGCLAEIRKMKNVKERLSEEYGCEPTAEDIAWEMNLPVGKVRALLATSRHSFVSMDAPVGEDSSATYRDVIQDTSARDPREEADRVSKTELIEEAAETLAGLERKVFLTFMDDPSLSLRETGKIFNLSGERIRQIRSAAFEKVRSYLETKDGGKPVHTFKGVEAKNSKPHAEPASDKEMASPVEMRKGFYLKMRAVHKNPNHHIWNNNGTWYCDFMLVTDSGERNRVRNPLHTDNVEDARRRRDEMILLYKGLSDTAA